MELKEIEEKVKTVITKATTDADFKKQLTEDPVKAVEGLLGVDLPDEQIKAVAAAVKSKIDGASGGVDELIDNAKDFVKKEGGIGGLFEKAEEAIEGILHKDK